MLAKGPTLVGVRRIVTRWNHELQRRLSPILLYIFSVVSVAIALGMGLAARHYGFRDLELPLLAMAIALVTWYAAWLPRCHEAPMIKLSGY